MAIVKDNLSYAAALLRIKDDNRLRMRRASWNRNDYVVMSKEGKKELSRLSKARDIHAHDWMVEIQKKSDPENLKQPLAPLVFGGMTPKYITFNGKVYTAKKV